MAIRSPLVIGSNGRPQQLQSGDSIAVPTTQTNTQALINNEVASIPIGTPVYLQAAGAVKKAQANAGATARVVGLVYDASIAASASGSIATDGVLSATTTQWDAITGQTGGLTFGSLYFLDPATAGKLTATPPTTAGQYNTLVGFALSSTVMDINIDMEILL